MNTIFQNNCLKGVPMMHKIFASLLCAAVAASASAVSDNQHALDQKVDSIQASRGVQIGGSIRGVAQASYFNSDKDKDGVNNMPDHGVALRRRTAGRRGVGECDADPQLGIPRESGVRFDCALCGGGG